MKSKTATILVGFTEGQWHRNRLRTALEKRGYSYVDDTQKADIIFAHSGGCYDVPLDLRPEQLVILINPTYWPGRSIVGRGVVMTGQMLRSMLPGYHPLYHTWKTLHNVVYLFVHIGQNLSIVHHVKRYKLDEELRHKNTILVRNKNDPWLTPNFRDLQRTHKSLKVVELPGNHEDCWLHPDRYIDLIELETKES